MITACDKCGCDCVEKHDETPESSTFDGLMKYLSKVNLEISVLCKDNLENIKKLKEQIVYEEKELDKVRAISHFMDYLIKSCYSNNLNDVALLDLMPEEKKQAVRTVKQCIDAGVVNCYRNGEEIEQFLTMREEEIAHQFKEKTATLCALKAWVPEGALLKGGHIVDAKLLRFYNNTGERLIMINTAPDSTSYPYFVLPVHDVNRTYLAFDSVPEDVCKAFVLNINNPGIKYATDSPSRLVSRGKLTIKYPRNISD